MLVSAVNRAATAAGAVRGAFLLGLWATGVVTLHATAARRVVGTAGDVSIWHAVECAVAYRSSCQHAIN